MPDDSNDHPVPQSKDKTDKINDSLQRLIHYAKAKATKEGEDVVADFKAAEQACRLIFSKIVVAQQSNSISKNALANFLDALSFVEAYRLHIVKKVDEALTWHAYYQREDPEQSLCTQEASQLEAVVKGKDEWRRVYMKILKRTVALDFYYLFTSEPWFASDFMVRLLEYNPHLFRPSNDSKTPCLREFIHDLSKDELEVVKTITRNSLQFVTDSHLWLEEHFEDDILLGLYSQEFQETHPPPANLQRLEGLLHYYLKYISNIYKMFTSIIPDKPSQDDD